MFKEFCEENDTLLKVIGGLFVLALVALYIVAFVSGVDVQKLNNFLVGIAALGACFTAVAVTAAFAQVMEARKQLRDNRNWNKMSFALTYFQHDRFEEWEKSLEASIQLITRDNPLTQAEVDRIFGDPLIKLPLKNFMNALESYCLAVNQGLADEETAKRKYKLKLNSHYAEMLPFIERMRQIHRSPTVFCEFQKVYERWSERPATPAVKY